MTIPELCEMPLKYDNETEPEVKLALYNKIVETLKQVLVKDF